MNIFSSSSPLDKRIESLTSEQFAEPPLELYLSLADEVNQSTRPNQSINQSPDFGQNLLKSIKKRLSDKKITPHAQFLTVNLLDIVVKNAGDNFHEIVSNREFLDFFASFATNNKYPHISDCALSMIQQWARAFPQAGLQSFAEVYQKLKNKGVAFPDQSITGNVSVLTPPVNLAVVTQRKNSNRGPDRSPVPRSPNRSPAPRSTNQPTNPLSWISPEYVQKIHVESEQILSFLSLFIDMINASTGVGDLKSNESIIGLHSTIVDCRGRVSHLLIELIDYESTESLMELLLSINQSIVDAIDYHQAKLNGMDIPPPVITKPAQLTNQSTNQSTNEQKDRSDEKSQGEPHPATNPSINQSMQNLTINQPPPRKTSDINPALAEFDPLS